MAIRSVLCISLLILLCSTAIYGNLCPDFYDKSCPNALSIVNSVVKLAIAKERRIGASLLRLHFHDCFVNGCDGSILLNDTSTFTGEKTANPNNNSVRGYEVIDAIKNQVEAACCDVVSCADIVAIAARDSVVQLGGPTWTVLLGRRDSTTASFTAANNDIPPPTSSLSNLISSFQAQGLSAKDMVALSGSHTIGKARCTSFRARIYNESNIDPTFARLRKANCPSTGGDQNVVPLDIVTRNVFDNNYYKNLIVKRGLLHSDQQLFNGGSSDTQVSSYTTNPNSFFNDFAAAMVNMGNIRPLTGKNGEIRKKCWKIN